MDKLDTNYQSLSEYQNKAYLIKLTATAAIGGLLFGYDTGVIGGANLYIYDDLGFNTPTVKETVVSIAIAGAILGSILCGRYSDNIGRKGSLIISDILLFIGSILMALAFNIFILIMGRFIVGMGIGFAAMIVPVYLAEVSPKELRGIVVSTNILFCTSGQLIAYLICLLFGNNWRAMLGLAALPALIQLIGMLMLPESPRWLVMQQREEEALNALSRIYYPKSQIPDDHQLKKVVKGIRQELKNQQNQNALKDIYFNYRKQLIVGTVLQIAQQLCGINTVMYYGPQVMIMAGFEGSGQSSIVASLPIAFTNTLGTIIALKFVDRLGRRSTLLWTLPGIVVFLLGLSVSFWIINVQGQSEQLQIAIVMFTTLYIAFFAIGMGPIPWTVNSEIYPLHLRSTGVGIATTANWISNFLVSMVFLSITSTKIGEIAAWGILAGFALLTWFFIYFMLPETKGLELDKIKRVFNSR